MLRVKYSLAVAVSIAAAAVVAAAVDAVTANGTRSKPAVATGLPIFNQPPVALSEAAKAAVLKALGNYQPNRAGVATDSLDEVRSFFAAGETAYVVPGTSETCLVFRSGSVCGNADATHPIIAAYAPDSTTHSLVGAGIATSEVSKVTVTFNGRSVTVPVIEGTFSIPPGRLPGSSGLPSVSFT